MQIYNPPLIKGMIFEFFISLFEFDPVFGYPSFQIVLIMTTSLVVFCLFLLIKGSIEQPVLKLRSQIFLFTFLKIFFNQSSTYNSVTFDASHVLTKRY
jgi:hypothetical protein